MPSPVALRLSEPHSHQQGGSALALPELPGDAAAVPAPLGAHFTKHSWNLIAPILQVRLMRLRVGMLLAHVPQKIQDSDPGLFN